LFALLVDALHDGLELNPFTGRRHGCVVQRPPSADAVELASLGYADDTAALATSLHDLHAQNEWVQFFMAFNRMRLNPLKCDVVGRMSGGAPLSQADLARHGISIDGHLPEPCAHDRPIRYLGLHVSFDGGWATQRKKTLGMVSMFTRLVSKFTLSLRTAVYMFNVFLLPKLELALHYVSSPGCSA
jgi:hypothetical protein